MTSARGLLLVALACSAAVSAEPRGASLDAGAPAEGRETRVGPPRGALFVVGGGGMAQLWPRFLELAGGPDASIVVIPTANEAVRDADGATLALRALGANQVVQVHTRERSVADSEAFTAPLRSARAVWFSGGRQWRLVDAYLGTRTQREILAVLERGGVVGGSSAGATIQGSYLVRGAVEGNRVMMAPGYEEGFALLRETAIDQHVDTRDRAEDLRPVLQKHRALLGIGLDEATALIVRGDTAEVIGAGRVRFFGQPEGPPLILTAGGRYDLAGRRPLLPSGVP